MLKVKRRHPAHRFIREAYFFVLNPLKRCYNHTFHPRTYGVKMILERDEQFLLVRIGYGHREWTFPGGKVDRGEEGEAAARRELFEEAGIRVEGGISIGSVENTHEGKRDKLEYFITTTDTEDIVIDDQEIIDAGWFHRDTLPQPIRKAVATGFSLYDTYHRNHA